MSPQLIVALLRWRGRQRLHLLTKERDDGLIGGKHLVVSKEFVRIDGNDRRKEVRDVRPARDLYRTRSSESLCSYII